MTQKILVVEDELTLLETLEYNFKRQGYDVYTAADGPAALEAARKERPDLILLDIMLPGLNGLEVCRILRKETTARMVQLLYPSPPDGQILSLAILVATPIPGRM